MLCLTARWKGWACLRPTISGSIASLRQNGLLLTRHTGRQPRLPHEGKGIALRSNSRWSSDGFEIACWKGKWCACLHPGLLRRASLFSLPEP